MATRMAVRRKTLIVAGLAAGALGVALVACSSAALDAFELGGDAGSGADGTSPSRDGGTAGDAGGLVPIQVDALILVHAAEFPAFRLCFEGALDQLPTPDSVVMPDSNVVGVDIGTAIRLPTPKAGALGHAFLYQEGDLRALYPAGGGTTIGPTCGALLKTNQTPYVAVGEVTTDLSYGVHALVLRGCRGSAADPQASSSRCGDDWTASDGNLTLSTTSLTAYRRESSMEGFPLQLVQLSPSLAHAAEGHALGVSFGVIHADAAVDAAAELQLIAEGFAPLGVAVPSPPAVLSFQPDDVPSYTTTGVYLSIDGPIDDAGIPIETDAQPTFVLSQSLAQIQQRSASRTLPPDWFTVASSYIVLSVGDLDPRLPDGGPDPDERRALHLLAVPLAAPDAGSDGAAN